METAITRTPLSTALILANLSGHTGVVVPCLASALISLFLTLNFPFIASQQDRNDIDLKASPLPPLPCPAFLTYQCMSVSASTSKPHLVTTSSPVKLACGLLIAHGSVES